MQKIPANASAATIVTNEVVGTILGSGWPAPPDDLSQIRFGATRPHGVLLEHAAVSVEYKARALNGIWETAPYLHSTTARYQTWMSCSNPPRSDRSHSVLASARSTPFASV